MSQDVVKRRIRELTTAIRTYRSQRPDERSYSDDQIRNFRRELSQLQEQLRSSERKSDPEAQILNAKSDSVAFRNFTVGFELETHATQGQSASTISAVRNKYNSERQTDEKKYRSFLASRVRDMLRTVDGVRRLPQNILDKEVARYIFIQKIVNGAKSKEDKELAQQFLNSGEWEQFVGTIEPSQRERLIINNNITIAALSKHKILNPDKVKQAEGALLEYVKKSGVPDQCKTGRNYSGVDVLETLIPDFDSKLLNIGTDGTVRGFEIRTVNGLSVRQFIKATDILFGPSMKHEVDTGCSFHLHVGVKDTRFPYNPAFQAALIEYLLEHIEEVPKAVQERWNTIATDHSHGRFFRPQVARDKYSFVNYHERCGTWEFRCFGNVNSKEDALKCLYLAMSAMVYAYKVVNKQVKPILSDIAGFNSKYNRDIVKSIAKLKPISTVVGG